MRKARAAAPAAASKPKPKPKPKPRARAKPKAKRSPLSGSSSPSAGSSGASPSPSPSPVAAVGRAFLPPASLSPVTPSTRSPLSALASPAPGSVSTVDGLRGLAASNIDSLRRRLDALHADTVRDLEASHSRNSKRIKMQTQSCLQRAEEADKDHKKMAEKISGGADEMKASYKKFVADVQASTARVCKVTVPEMAMSVERAIDGLRTRFNIPATAP